MTVSSYPRIAIVTPAYNAEVYLRETIASVLSQDYPHIEYVVMDGGSTDGTVEILKGYGRRVRWISRPDSGQADAVNRGFRLTNGDIFTFLNADDTYLPGAIAAIVREFQRHPGAGLIYGEAYHVNGYGSVLGRYPTLPFDWQELGRRCFICQPAAFIRRDAFEAAGMLDSRLHYALDYELWMRLSKMYPIVKIDRYLATSRMHPRNKTLRDRKRVYREMLAVVKKHYGYAPYQWLIGFACHLIDGKDQFFEQSEQTVLSYGLSLLLGLYYNPGRWMRYWREWRREVGVGQPFRGRWEDRWISKTFETECEPGPASRSLTIFGNHAGPFRWPLKLRISIGGRQLGRHSLRARGPFEIRLRCPPEVRGSCCRLTIEADRTFRPMRGDYRRLSCMIDSISFEDEE